MKKVVLLTYIVVFIIPYVVCLTVSGLLDKGNYALAGWAFRE